MFQCSKVVYYLPVYLCSYKYYCYDGVLVIRIQDFVRHILICLFKNLILSH